MSDAVCADKRCALSLQVFPPRTEEGMLALCGSGGVLEQLYDLQPDFISCTYSPGGLDLGKNLKVMDKLLLDGKTQGVTHFTCTGNTREGVRGQLQTYRDHGVSRLLVFRGAAPSGRGDSFGSSDALIRYIRQEFDSGFSIAAAGTPETGIDGWTLEKETESLKRKRDSGAERIVTRLCWDGDAFCRWMEALRAADIWLPVRAAVLPVVDQADILTYTARGGNVPRELSGLIGRNWIYPNPFVKDPFDAEAEGKKRSFREAGIDYTLRQIGRYQACGVEGIHLHTGNRYADAARILREAGL